MKRLGRGRYQIGHFEVCLESWGKWRVWDTSDDPPTPLDALPTKREAGEYCRKELELERIQNQ